MRQANVPMCCAATFFYDLYSIPKKRELLMNSWDSRQCAIAIFRDGQKNAYETLRKKFKILSQTPPFMGNSGRELIVVVYKVGE